MHIQPLFKDAKKYVDGTSEELYNHGLCVASSTTMTKDDVKMICDLIISNDKNFVSKDIRLLTVDISIIK